MMVAEMSFRRLNAPESVEKVADGKKYENGKQVRGRRLILFTTI
jgi:hypothetical protein